MQQYILENPDPFPAIAPEQPPFRCISVWLLTLQETNLS